MHKQKGLKFLKLFLLLCCMLLLPAMKTNAANPEWMFFFPGYVTTAFMDDGEFMWIGTNNYWTYKVDKLTQTKVDSIKCCGNYITKDKDGIVWVGANSGLYKYDGINITNYRTDNSGLPDNTINTIVIDKDNVKWLAVGAEKGLVKFDGTNWTVYNTKNSGIPSNYIMSIALDKYNDLWISTMDKGLAKFDRTNWQVFNDANSGLHSNYLSDIKFDKTGNLWIGSNRGLTKFEGESWIVYNKTNSSLPDTIISKIAIDSSNNIWFGSDSDDHHIGLGKFDGIQNWTIYNTSNSSIKSDGVYAITIDKTGNKWIGVSSLDDPKTGVNIFKEGGVILNVDENNNLMPSNYPLIYPNPVNDKIRIMNYEFSKYIIYNVKGELILNGYFTDNEISVVDLPNGFYCINLVNGSKSIYLKFLKI